MTKYSRRTPNCKCFACGSEFYLRPSDRKKSKSGRFSCSRECRSKIATLTQVEKIEERLGVADFAGWLNQKYHIEKLNTREISRIVYGYTNGGGISRWMDRLGIKRRSRSEAVAMQWKDNPERKKQAAKDAIKNMGAGTPSRGKLVKTMQTEEYRRKQSESKMGERNGMYGMTGASNPRWNHELTEEDRLHSRKYPEYERWRRAVYERDDYTCQKCKSKRGGDLVAHHINGYHWDKASRIELDNGVTLCERCHLEFHSIYGYGDNDLFQFAQFMDLTLTK